MPAGEKTGSSAAAPSGSHQLRPGTQSQGEAAALSGAGVKRNGDVPSWNGPEQSVGGSATNGDPFTTRLNGDAVEFSPSIASGPAGPIPRTNSDDGAHAGPLIVSSNGRSYNASRPVQRPPVTFSTDVGPGVATPGGHYIKAENFPSAELNRGLKDVCENFGWERKLRSFVISGEIQDDRYVTIWLAFDDMRDCPNAIEHLEMISAECQISYVTQTEFVFGARTGDEHGIHCDDSSFYDGQLVLKATFAGREEDVEVDGLYEEIAGLCRQIGPLVAVRERIMSNVERHFRVEFNRIRDAQYMAASMTEDAPELLMGWSVVATELQDPNLDKSPGHVAMTPKHLRNEGPSQHYVSPTGRTAWKAGNNGKSLAVMAPNQLPKVGNIPAGHAMTPMANRFRGSDPTPYTPVSYAPQMNHPRSGSYPSAINPPMTAPHRKTRMPEFGPNVINVERIEKGIDVRTTIMIRNIPNIMTAEELKDVIDKVCPGRCNFMYLRFDFGKHKNVGYAFANFLTAADVLTFYRAYNGKEYVEGMGWHPVFGPRRGEIAYATCQGQECAIEKFRNSSIMDEFPGYRPRLFWSEEDAPLPGLVGKDRPFPKVNNMSKHNRSKDNAAQIGLYAPKSRQGAIIPRNSQFDRGTTAQIHEDAAFHHQQQMVRQALPYGFNDAYVYGNQNVSMPMGMGMPMTPYGMAYGAVSPFSHPPNMHGVYPPSAPAFNGSPRPMMPGQLHGNFNGSPVHMNGNNVHPSRLRTITQGRLGNPPRGNRFTVRPPRDTETAIREIEEGKRELAEYEARKAQREADEAAAEAQGAEVPRAMNGDHDVGANHQEYGYPNGDHSGFGYAETAYANGYYPNGDYFNGGQDGYQ